MTEYTGVTKTIYKIIENPMDGELPYKAFEVPVDFPVEMGYTSLDPTGYRYPKWDGSKWVEDSDKVMKYLVQAITELDARVKVLEDKLQVIEG